MSPFERLDAWHRCHDLTLAAYVASRDWPDTERLIRRAAISAEANIAEGAAKRGKREFRRYLDIALGSLSEFACLLRVARDLGYINENDWNRLEPVRANASKVTWRLYQAMSRGDPPRQG